MEVLTGDAARQFIEENAAHLGFSGSDDEPKDTTPVAINGGADILALFGDEPVAHYVQVTVPCKNQLLTLHLKRLSNKEEATLDARITRKNNTAVSVQDDDMANVNAAAIIIAEMVHRQVGDDAHATFERMFTVKQLLGEPAVKRNGKIIKEAVPGLFDYADPDAKDFVESVAGLCYEMQPALMPALKKTTEALMRERILGTGL